MRLTITEDNFEYYLRVYEVLHKNIIGLLIQNDSEYRGLATYDPVEKLQTLKNENLISGKIALKGGVIEILTMIDHCPHETILQINCDLKNNDLGSLFQLISLVKGTVSKVIRVRKINKLEEYYIIKEKLDDLSSGLSVGEREKLSRYLINYESKNKKQLPLTAALRNGG